MFTQYDKDIVIENTCPAIVTFACHNLGESEGIPRPTERWWGGGGGGGGEGGGEGGGGRRYFPGAPKNYF